MSPEHHSPEQKRLDIRELSLRQIAYIAENTLDRQTHWTIAHELDNRKSLYEEAGLDPNEQEYYAAALAANTEILGPIPPEEPSKPRFSSILSKLRRS